MPNLENRSRELAADLQARLDNSIASLRATYCVNLPYNWVNHGVVALGAADPVTGLYYGHALPLSAPDAAERFEQIASKIVDWANEMRAYA